MTAPSAPGVALKWYRAQFVAHHTVVMEQAHWGELLLKAWGSGAWGTDNPYSHHAVGEWPATLEGAKLAAEAWLREYRDAQDQATNPERRRAVAEVPEGGWGAEVLPAKPFNPVDWTPTPPPDAAPTPAPDWEARRWEAALAALSAVIRQCAGDLPMQPAGTVAEEYFAGKSLSIADALIAAMQEKKP